MRYTFAGQFVQGRVVVDIACGTGIGTHLMRRFGAKTCIGLDLNQRSLQHAATTYSDCNFACCDALRLCLPDSVADAIVSCETIEHFADPRAFVAECARVLRPGGLMICSTPNHTVYRWGGRNPYHLHEMNANEFLELFKDLYTEAQLYGQWQIVYPAYVLKQSLLEPLQSLRLKSLLERAIGRAGDRGYADKLLVEDARYSEFEVKPYDASPFLKPMYLVVMARKASRVEDRQ